MARRCMTYGSGGPTAGRAGLPMWVPADRLAAGRPACSGPTGLQRPERNDQLNWTEWVAGLTGLNGLRRPD
ncbi:hypothetical protein GCM10025331_42770 [Actinoplanes utahensis]